MHEPTLLTPPPVPPEIVAAHGLSPGEYEHVLQALGRNPTMTELGLFSVMWSEHCSYKSSRVHLRKFPTTGPHVIYGPGENAGVIDIGDGLACIFKMESHNHPSFIEPYQGAATGVGGILRDVFTMGARPIALMNALRFGSPDHPKTRRLVAGVVSGIGGYGNCVGVPTVGGETNFHPAYNGNILVNVFCAGLAETDKIFTSAARGVGHPIVYVGAKTGRDGIHGATMASAEFDDKSEEKRPTVQVGDPFREKLLIEACLELMKEDAIVSIQDMGAAGLTSSSIEMAGKGNVGIFLNLDKTPMRETGMSAYEIMLSESQERMLMILKPGREPVAERIFAKWGLDAAVIGETTDTGRIVLQRHGEIVADCPVGPLADEAPLYERPFVRPARPAVLETEFLPVPIELGSCLLKLMGCPDIASKEWIWRQYDRHVMGDTVAESGGDAAIVRIHGSNRALGMTCDVTPRYVQADPYEGGKQAVAEAYRNLSAVGARPLAVTDNLNFGNPQKPEIMGQIVAAIEGMAEACRALDTPVVSGNVSLYNETNGKAILPTPTIGAVGLIDDLGFKAGFTGAAVGDVLIAIGETHGHVGQSLYLREVLGREDGAPPPVDLSAEKDNGSFVRSLIAAGHTRVVHDVADGGLAIAAVELALANNIGVHVHAPSTLPAFAFFFGEDQARYLVSVPANAAQSILAAAQEARVTASIVGGFAGDGVTLLAGGIPVAQVALADIRKAHENWLPDYMNAVA